MAHHTDPELLNNVLQLLTEQGHDGFAEGLRLLVNEAMRVERHQVLQAQPCRFRFNLVPSGIDKACLLALAQVSTYDCSAVLPRGSSHDD